MAGIMFFFKTKNLVTMSTDSITNKMIQGLGVNVFTKQYLIEVPHDAYMLDKDGLDFKVVEELDYFDKKYLHCLVDDGISEKDIYILVDKNVKDYSGQKLAFDVSKIHITEKGMDIKIY